MCLFFCHIMKCTHHLNYFTFKNKQLMSEISLYYYISIFWIYVYVNVYVHMLYMYVLYMYL